MSPSADPNPAQTGVGRTRQFVTVGAWLTLLGGYWWYTTVNGLTPLETMQLLVDFVSTSPYGFLIYVVAYMIRPVFLFPATLLTMTAAYLYGPWRGIAYALIASNLSTLIAYAIGRFLSRGLLDDLERNPLVARYADLLRGDGFQTTLVLRFLFVPYDLVSILSGFLRIHVGWFMLATILGSIPGTISFGLLGASIEGDLTTQTVSLNPWALIASLLMFAVSLGLYRLARRRLKPAAAPVGETSTKRV